MNKKQHVLRRSSCFSSQSSECQKVLVDLITSKSNNSKWLNFAQYKLSVKSKYGRIGCLQAEDYLSAIKVLILEAVTVTDASTPFPRFTIIINDEPYSMTSKELITYFFLLIKWEISNTLKNEVKTIPLPQWDEDDKGEPASEDDILLCRDNPGSDFIVPFNDPFDENEIYNSKVFVEECCQTLEKENLLYRVVFEERLNGSPNRNIARKYKISVREVENINKKIHRRLSRLRRDDLLPDI